MAQQNLDEIIIVRPNDPDVFREFGFGERITITGQIAHADFFTAQEIAMTEYWRPLTPKEVRFLMLSGLLTERDGDFWTTSTLPHKAVAFYRGDLIYAPHTHIMGMRCIATIPTEDF